MPATYDLIQTGTVTAFTNIPQTYTDLVLVIDSIKASNSTVSPRVRFNLSTDSYPTAWLYNNTSTAIAGFEGGSTGIVFYFSMSGRPTEQYGGSSVLEILNYTGSTKKGWIAHGTKIGSNAQPEQFLSGGNWDNTSAITRIDIGVDAGNIASITSSLYGIKRA